MTEGQDIRDLLRQAPTGQPSWTDPDRPLREMIGQIELSAPAPGFRQPGPDGSPQPRTFKLISSTARLENDRYAYRLHLLLDRDTELGVHFAVLTHEDELRGGGSLRVTSRHQALDEALDVINTRVAALTTRKAYRYLPQPGSGPLMLTREQALAEARLRVL